MPRWKRPWGTGPEEPRKKTAWQKIATGIHVGQPYLDRAHSEFRDHWCVRVDKHRSADKRQRYIKVGPDEQAAIAAAREIAEAGVASVAPACGRVLQAWVDQYGKQLKSETAKVSERYVNRELVWFAKLPIDNLTNETLWEFVVELMEGRKLSPLTATQALAWLRRAINLAWHGELAQIKWRPAPGQESPSRRISQTATRCLELYDDRIEEREAFYPEEARIVLAVAQEVKPEFYPLVRLAFGTGLRPGELRALRWDCVDVTLGILFVKRAFSGDVLGSVKKRKRRRVMLSPGCLEMLTDMHKVALEKMHLRMHPENAPEFVFENDHLWLTQNQTTQAMAEIMTEARKRGVRQKLSLYSCRHTYVSQGRAHLSDLWLQEQTGHSAAMQRRYTHIHTVERPELGWADFDIE